MMQHSQERGGAIRRAAVLAALAAVAVPALAATPAVTGAQVRVDTVTTPDRGTRVMTLRRPEGYIGITYSGAQTVEVRGGRAITTYADYPAIVAVEPGSPAQRAGIVAGDTLLAFNDRDLKSGPVVLADIMKPGARVSVRLRRNGAVRAATMEVARRPAAVAVAPLMVPGSEFRFVFPEVHADPAMQEEVRREVERAMEQMKRELERNRELSERQKQELRRVAARAAQVAAVPAPTPPVALAFGGTFAGVAGAEMTPLNDDLAELVRVRKGVFVVKVNPGTPAERSGLRSGDVIVAVGDSAVADVAQVRRAITAAQRQARASGGERAVPVEIVRKQRKQKVTLRW